ncbi:Putative uncharacterized protein (plasmid) [Cardinium endosymbiont cEper1 of Encarsia pergandiella]|nr:Putative uncharacterized protein [Cardinium endosymbiont cEper1 of Encarsia pergandiella]
MIVFYFFLALFLIQGLYWLKLSGIPLNERYLKWAVEFVFKSKYIFYSRLILVSSISFLGWDRLKTFIKNAFDKNKSWIPLVLLFFWLLFTICFVYFERTCLYLYSYNCLKSYISFPSHLFILFLLYFGIPFWFHGDIKPSVKRDKKSIVLPKGYDKKSPFSIAIPTTNGKLPINNPQRGIYILGGAGSGKSIYILEPILYAMIKKGYCGIVYDYDFEGIQTDPRSKCCLSKFVYNCYIQLPEKERNKFSFKTINFTDLNKSSRINPIDPIYIEDREYLDEYVTVLLKNLNPVQKDDFWLLSTKSLLKGMIIYLCNQAPNCCTLPHVLLLSTKPIDKILGLIEQDKEAYMYSSSIFDAYKGGEKSSAQLSGITASFKTSLQPLLNKKLFWVLSKNEVNLTINDRYCPTLLCIGNFPAAKSAFSPVISLLLTVCFKSMYGHGRNKSFVSIDELSTLYIPGISEIPATARKYGISMISCIQSNAQLEDTYGHGGAKKLRDILSNQFIGKCGIESFGYASSLFGKEAHIVKSTSSSETYHAEGKGPNTTRGENISIHDKDVLQSQDFVKFPVGYFAGSVAESEGTFFEEQFRLVSDYDKSFKNKVLKDLPDINYVTDEDIMLNQKRIEEDIDALVV